MADEAVHERIEQLVAEEHELFQRAEGGSGLSDEEDRRLETIRVGLDQLPGTCSASGAHFARQG